jgi:integrase
VPIRRRAEGSWIVDLTVNGHRYRKTLPATLRKRDVEAVERQWRTDLERPVSRHATATVGAIIGRYWSEKACLLADAQHLDTYLGMWGEALGIETPITQVQADHISAVLARWRRDVSNTTVNRRMATLRACWRWAADVWGVPLHHVAWKRMRLDEPESADRSIGAVASARLLSAWPERSHRVALLALATGLRLSAILRLERRDIDLDRQLIRTVGKGRAGGKENLVPITAEVAEILAGLELPDVGRIFPLNHSQVRKDRERARKLADLPNFRFHDLRHEFAQTLEDAGFGDTITAALHHSSPALRRRYAHARLDRTREDIETAMRHRVGTTKPKT